MDRRLELHELLCTILGSRHVYFQPPPTIQLVYPCIIYSLKDILTHMGDDTKYIKRKAYDIIVVDEDPDSSIPDKIGELQYSSFKTQYVTDQLYHTTYQLYF